MNQLNLFELIKKPYKITKPIRLIELFAGIGAQAAALKRLHVRYENYRVIEVDQHAVDSYNEIHNTDFNVSDITHAAELEWDDFEDAVQSVTAERVHADYIITRNVRDFAKSKVVAFTPSELIARI